MTRRRRDIFNPTFEGAGGFEHTRSGVLDYEQAAFEPLSGEEVGEEKAHSSFRLVKILLVLAFSVLAVRIIDLSTIQHQKYLSLAEGNRLRTQYLMAPRGVVFDKNGLIIAHNKPSFDLVVTPYDLPRENNDSLISSVSQFFGLPEEEIEDIISVVSADSFQPILLKRNIEEEKALAFVTLQDDYPGFQIQNSPLRQYEEGPVFSHLIGYTGKLNEGEYAELKDQGYLFNDEIGKNGIELTYEEYLRGIHGQRLVEVDAAGRLVDIFRQTDPVPGSDMILNVDKELQEVLYESLKRNMEARGASKAAAVALDPRTGGVVALVSLPGYDNNWFAGGISSENYKAIAEDKNIPLFNRAISGTYPPGSTVKPFEAAGVLQEGVVDEDTRILDEGALYVPNRYNPSQFQVFRGWNPNGLGNVDAREAIAVSSDIYFYTVGGGQSDLEIDGMGPDRLARYFNLFFLGRLTGIDLPTEKTGLVPTTQWKLQRFPDDPIEQRWYLGDTYNMSIGQGFMLATPLQIAVATAAIANGGTVYKPQIVNKIESSKLNPEKIFEPIVLGEKFIDDRYIKVAQEGMRLAVTEGTARYLNTLQIPIAGKTGTSQFDGSDLSRTHAWFTSYAPYDDPQLVITILVEAGGEGSSAAVPVARDVYDWYQKNRIRFDNQ